MQLLIAEDNRAARLMLRRNIERWGYDVVEAANGREAWERLNTSDAPRIAVLDWVMPELDGVDICRLLSKREQGPLVYVILLTSKTDKEDLVAGLDSGAHDFLSKPVDNRELKSRIAVGQRLIEAEDALRRAMDHIKTLRGLLPICANCKSIRDDEGYWQAIETYVGQHSGAEFSHSICPDCARKLYPEYYADDEAMPENQASEHRGQAAM